MSPTPKTNKTKLKSSSVAPGWQSAGRPHGLRGEQLKEDDNPRYAKNIRYKINMCCIYNVHVLWFLLIEGVFGGVFW